jgi:hypothetical protein
MNWNFSTIKNYVVITEGLNLYKHYGNSCICTCLSFICLERRNSVTSYGHCVSNIGQRPSLNRCYRVSKLVEVREEKVQRIFHSAQEI